VKFERLVEPAPDNAHQLLFNRGSPRLQHCPGCDNQAFQFTPFVGLGSPDHPSKKFRKPVPQISFLLVIFEGHAPGLIYFVCVFVICLQRINPILFFALNLASKRFDDTPQQLQIVLQFTPDSALLVFLSRWRAGRPSPNRRLRMPAPRPFPIEFSLRLPPRAICHKLPSIPIFLLS